jgi:eukaryotic-like serine/threonine-protein kinase
MMANTSENDEYDDDPMGHEVDPYDTVYLPSPLEIQVNQIGRYKQIRKLGEGQFGIVWLGFDEQLQRPVAIKISKSTRSEHPLSPNSTPNEMELTEARNVALLDHPNIVPVYDVGITKDLQFYVVSKFIEGETLASTLIQRRWSAIESIRFVQTIAEALAHAHERGLVHRDIKPANILIDRQNGRAHVIDFGLAFYRKSALATQGLVGTPIYMSPEQVRCDTAAVDARSDIFSLGVILYEMLAQRLPFSGPTMAELFDQILHREPRPIGSLVDGLDDEVAAICTRALSKSPEDRFATAAELSQALSRYVSRVEQSSRLVDGPSSSLPSKLLGEYRLIELIGEGGLGDVYRAEHRVMQRLVAIKLLHQHQQSSLDRTHRFLQEIRLVAKLSHPNIVTAFDAGREAGQIYMVMELVEGESLADRVSRMGPLSAAEAIHVVRQVATALEYAHARKIVHRDIKPGNLMVNTQGIIKVLDFGLAILNDNANKLREGETVGTPHFMAPEQSQGLPSVDGRADLYSLGATLFSILTGRPMFDGEPEQIALSHQRRDVPNLYEFRPSLDLRVDSIFKRLVAKLPSDRFASASELLQTLDQLRLPEIPIRKVNGSVFLKGLYKSQPTSDHDRKPSTATQSTALGIDLGQASSTVAWCHPDHGPQLIEQPDGQGHQLRNMLWSIGDHVKIGASAMKMRQIQPSGIFHSLQRWIGMPRVKRLFGGKSVPPEVLLAALLHRLLSNARRQVTRASQAVVTVPSCYDQAHRRAILVACQIAGVDVLQLLDKPLAVVLAWLATLDKGPESQRVRNATVLIVHLGGSGLEASVAAVQDRIVRLKGTHGDWQSGSQRWIRVLSDNFAAELHRLTGADIHQDALAATRLQRTVELVIDRLTVKPSVEMRFEWRGSSIVQKLTQDRLLAMVPVIGSEVSKAIEGACAAAQIQASDIQHVILAGIMMRLKPLQKIVEECVPQASSLSLLEKNELARGAAMQARSLTSADAVAERFYQAIPCLVYDFAIPVPTVDKTAMIPRLLIERGSPLPAMQLRSLRFDESLPQELQLIESTRHGFDAWHRLGSLNLRSAFPDRPERDPLSLKMEVDNSGLLRAELLWTSAGKSIAFPGVGNTISTSEIESWRTWLETLMLCSS